MCAKNGMKKEKKFIRSKNLFPDLQMNFKNESVAEEIQKL
jgi:hypothetical protein